MLARYFAVAAALALAGAAACTDDDQSAQDVPTTVSTTAPFEEARLISVDGTTTDVVLRATADGPQFCSGDTCQLFTPGSAAAFARPAVDSSFIVVGFDEGVTVEDLDGYVVVEFSTPYDQWRVAVRRSEPPGGCVRFTDVDGVRSELPVAVPAPAAGAGEVPC